MTGRAREPALRCLLAAVGRDLSPGDEELLRRFQAGRDEAAFEAIVRRHGPMVLAVCRRVLGNVHDAEDAFQATFLVLARKAGSLRQPGLLGNWLYGVACRTARKARTRAARRRARETLTAEVPHPCCETSHAEREFLQLLDRELSQLPDKYRGAVVLCDLQGRSRKEASRQLRLPEGTLSSRLATARRLLARRLARRGVVLSGGLALALQEQARGARMPPGLLADTGRAAVSAPARPLPLVALTEGVLQMIWSHKLKSTAGALFLGLAVAGLALLGRHAVEAEVRGTPPAEKPRAAVPPADKAGGEWQDVLRLADPDKYTVGKGVWRKKDGKVTAYPAHGGARLRVPVVPTGTYELRARWEPKNERASAIFLLPHGEQVASVELLGWLGCSGLGDLNGVRPDVNETRKDLKLTADKVYLVEMRMHWTDKQVHVQAKLDGRTFIDWEGKRAEVDHQFYAPGKTPSLGLAIDGNVSVFHSLELRMQTGKAEAWKPAPAGESAR